MIPVALFAARMIGDHITQPAPMVETKPARSRRCAILSVARSGKFSSDPTTTVYA